MIEIPDAPGYFATEFGDIYSQKSNKYLKLLMTNSGYLKFNAYYGSRGTLKNYYVHRAVCLAYHGLPTNPNHEVRHIDNNKLNNKYNNLCWGSSKDNHSDQVLHGTDPKGERNPFAKFTNNDILKIRQLHTSGLSCQKIADIFHVAKSTIIRIINRKTWSHV